MEELPRRRVASGAVALFHDAAYDGAVTNVWLALLALLAPAATLTASAQAPIAQNSRVTVWDVASGAPAPQPVPADARTVVIELQDVTVPPLANTSGQPLAFPRPGVTKLLENERVVVWSATWTLGSVTPTHFHDKDAVAFFLADGTLGGTDAQGQTGSSDHHFGLIRLAPRGRQHTEALIKGKASALIVELKQA